MKYVLETKQVHIEASNIREMAEILGTSRKAISDLCNNKPHLLSQFITLKSIPKEPKKYVKKSVKLN